MEGNICIGILTESNPLTAAIGRSLSRDGRFEVRALDAERDDLRAPDGIDLLLVSPALPRGGALRLLGRSWVNHRFPRLLFVHAGQAAGDNSTLTTRCSAELAELANSAVRGRGPLPSRVTLRFLESESGQGGAKAAAS